MTLAIISHPACVLHNPGGAHPERPDRVIVIEKALAEFAFKQPVKFYEAPLATREQLISTHEKNYVDWIFSVAPRKEVISLDEDTWMDPHTLQAALRAAGSVPFAVDLVMTGKAQSGPGRVNFGRPPPPKKPPHPPSQE